MLISEALSQFLQAADDGDLAQLQVLLATGVDINATNRQGRTAITLASLKQRYACVEYLIAQGADINKQDQTCLNPFLIACLNNDVPLSLIHI